MAQNANIEGRYSDNRLRYFRLEKGGPGRYNVQTSISHVTSPQLSYPEQIRLWGAHETMLVSTSAEGAREFWYWNVSMDEVKSKLKAWRSLCAREGLTNIVRTHMS